MNIEHYPQYGMYRISDKLTIKLTPTDILSEINHVLELLLKEFEGLNPTLDDIVGVIKIAGRYNNHKVTINPGMRYHDVTGTYRITPYCNGMWKKLDAKTLLRIDRSLEENAKMVSEALRDYQINEAILELRQRL